MALNLSQKQEVVAELAGIAAKAHSLVAAEYAGTTVEQMTAMRKKARETGVYLRVVKNTLASRAYRRLRIAYASLITPHDTGGRAAPYAPGRQYSTGLSWRAIV